jgi:hypothetical protein
MLFYLGGGVVVQERLGMTIWSIAKAALPIATGISTITEHLTIWDYTQHVCMPYVYFQCHCLTYSCFIY